MEEAQIMMTWTNERTWWVQVGPPRQHLTALKPEDSHRRIAIEKILTSAIHPSGARSPDLRTNPMSEPHAPPQSDLEVTAAQPPRPSPLYTQRSWSPDAFRDEAWVRRKGNWKKKRRSKSVTDDDVDELKGCIELGFGFGSTQETQADLRLSDTIPALGLYYVVNKNYNDSKSTLSTTSFSSTASDCDSIPSPIGSPHNGIFARGDNPQVVKTRLRQWAQVVACAVREVQADDEG